VKWNKELEISRPNLMESMELSSSVERRQSFSKDFLMTVINSFEVLTLNVKGKCKILVALES